MISLRSAAKLTDRELLVYELITTTSLTRKELADKIFMCYSNFARYEDKIYRKLGMANRIELIFARYELN